MNERSYRDNDKEKEEVLYVLGTRNLKMSDKKQGYWLWTAENESCGAKFAVIARTKDEAIATMIKDYSGLCGECACCNDPEYDKIENLPWKPWAIAELDTPTVVAITLVECAEVTETYDVPEH